MGSVSGHQPCLEMLSAHIILSSLLVAVPSGHRLIEAGIFINFLSFAERQ
jgi:hypothetical protein